MEGRQTDRQREQKERPLFGYNFTAGCFYGYLLLWMVRQKKINGQTQTKRQVDRQAEKQRKRIMIAWLVQSS